MHGLELFHKSKCFQMGRANAGLSLLTAKCSPEQIIGLRSDGDSSISNLTEAAVLMVKSEYAVVHILGLFHNSKCYHMDRAIAALSLLAAKFPP